MLLDLVTIIYSTTKTTIMHLHYPLHLDLQYDCLQCHHMVKGCDTPSAFFSYSGALVREARLRSTMGKKIW